MDFISAEPIIQTLHQRIDHGIFGYTRPTSQLRITILERVKRLYHWEIKEEEIVFLPGLVTGLNVAYHAFSHPGDGVLVQTPVYFHFVNDPVMHGRALDDCPLVQKGDTYEIDFDDFEKSIFAPNQGLSFLQSPQSRGTGLYEEGVRKGRRDLPSP